MSSRDAILNKLRAARRPFEDAPPRPKTYLHVTEPEQPTTEGLIERFSFELTRLLGTPLVVHGDAEARDKVIELLRQHNASRIIAWDFAHIPVEGLEAAIRDAGIEILHPDARGDARADELTAAESAQVSLTGVDAAAAGTGTLIVRTGPGMGRLPTILAPVHIAVIRAAQIVPNLEAWFAAQKADDLMTSANFCLISGPSRTGDIEMELILGVHGPGVLYGVVIL